jgi:hypothetical protein
MSEDRSVVRSIAWREVFPWLRLLSVFRLAIRPRSLLLAFLGAMLCTALWSMTAKVFSGSDDASVAVAEGNGRAPGFIARTYTSWPWEPVATWKPAPRVNVAVSSDAAYAGAWFGSARPIQQLIGFGHLFDPSATTTLTAFLLLCLLWAIAVWALVGGMITRIAAISLARGEQIAWGKAQKFAMNKYLAYCASPLLPIVGALLITLLIAIFSLLMRIPYVGIPLMALAWIPLLVGGMLIAILLLGLVVSWPLMWATISCEGTDSFDALGRSYGYLFGRPLQYLGYALVAFVLGSLGYYVVDLFAEWIVKSTFWAVSWGAGSARLEQFFMMLGPGSPDDVPVIDARAAQLIDFFNSCVRTIPTAFIFSYFWNATVMVYLLLRRDEDQTEIDEVYLEEEPESYGLPPLRTSAAGVSEPADVPPAPPATPSAGPTPAGPSPAGPAPAGPAPAGPSAP